MLAASLAHEELLARSLLLEELGEEQVRLLTQDLADQELALSSLVEEGIEWSVSEDEDEEEEEEEYAEGWSPSEEEEGEEEEYDVFSDLSSARSTFAVRNRQIRRSGVFEAVFWVDMHRGGRFYPGSLKNSVTEQNPYLISTQ
jgi:hypothetical protein